MFGMFTVIKDGVPIPIRGKAKEILALILVKRGREISNEEIYSTIWETREYSNVHMKVYYNALKRLKDSLEKYGISNVIFSTARGQMANVDAFDCDYYSWQDGSAEKKINLKENFCQNIHGENTYWEILFTVINRRLKLKKTYIMKNIYSFLYCGIEITLVIRW